MVKKTLRGLYRTTRCRGAMVRPRRPAGRSRAGSSLAPPELALDVALSLALADGLALVVELLTLGQPQLQLGPAGLQVHAERDQREALDLDPLGQLADLLLVQQ